MGKDIIIETFIKEIPNRLKSYGYTAQGGFEELLSVMEHISKTHKASEIFREVKEPVKVEKGRTE